MRLLAWRLTVAAAGIAMTLFGVGTANVGAQLLGGPIVPLAVACCGALIVAVAACGRPRVCEATMVICCALWTARGATFLLAAIEDSNTVYMTNAFGAWTIAPLTVLALTATRRKLHDYPRWRNE